MTYVLAIEVADKPGGLIELLSLFAEAKVNVSHMYAFTERLGQSAVLVFSFDDLDAAITCLTRAGINPVTPVYLYDQPSEIGENSKYKIRNLKQIQTGKSRSFGTFGFCILNLFGISIFVFRISSRRAKALVLQRLLDQDPAVLLEKVERQNGGLTVDLGTEFFGELPDRLAGSASVTMRRWYSRVAAIAAAKYARTSSRPTSAPLWLRQRISASNAARRSIERT